MPVFRINAFHLFCMAVFSLNAMTCLNCLYRYAILYVFFSGYPDDSLFCCPTVRRYMYMTQEQKSMIERLRRDGNGYKSIAAKLGVPVNTVKSYFRRHHSGDKPDSGTCLQCGTIITQTPHKRRRIFCSDECRMQWWTEHRSLQSEGKYEHTCKCCGRVFKNKRKEASYCSRRCFAIARRKEESSDETGIVREGNGLQNHYVCV